MVDNGFLCNSVCLIFISLIYASEHNGFCLRTIINQMELYNRGLMNISWNNSGYATVCVYAVAVECGYIVENFLMQFIYGMPEDGVH